MNQRVYNAKLDEKDGIRRIDDGDVLVETINPWQTWIGEWGDEVHSTKSFPPERLLVPRDKADHLVAGNAAVIVERPEPKPEPKPKPKRKKPVKRATKALEPEENK